MVNPLRSLLGLAQASAVGAPDPLEQDQQPNTGGDGIVVEASRDDPYVFENPQDVSKRDIGLEAGRNASDHRGMFGVKGTLRDVLGVVGDAFLIQSGNKPIYTPHKRQEELSDAMAGFTEGPIAAIERVAGINPEVAAKMKEQYDQNQYRSGQLGAANLRAQTNASDLERKKLQSAMDYVSQSYAAAIASGDPAAMAKAEQLAMLVSQQFGVPLSDLGVTPGMTPEEAAVLAGRAATVNQNLRLPQYERGLDLREEAEAGRNRRAAEAERGRNRRASEAERGRNERSERTDRRVRELDEDRGTGSSGPRRLRGSESNPTSSLRIRPVGR